MTWNEASPNWPQATTPSPARRRLFITALPGLPDENDRWWDPSLGCGNYWPEVVPRVLSCANLAAALATLGYAQCETADLEPDFEKLAVYADEYGVPTHVARQLPSGSWTSKLGTAEDIEHDRPASLEGTVYGLVVRYLRRPRPAGA